MLVSAVREPSAPGPAAGGSMQVLHLGSGPFSVMDLSLGGVAEPRKTPRTPRTMDTATAAAELWPSSNGLRPLILGQGSSNNLLSASQLQLGPMGASSGAPLTSVSASALNQAGLGASHGLQLSNLASLQAQLGLQGLQGRGGPVPPLLLQSQGLPLASSQLLHHQDLPLAQEQEMLKMHVNMACSQRAAEQLEVRLVQERQCRNNDRIALNAMLHDFNTQLRTEVLRRQIAEQQLAVERKLRNDLLAEITASGQACEDLLRSDRVRTLLQQLADSSASGLGAMGPQQDMSQAVHAMQAVQGAVQGASGLGFGVKTPRADSNACPAPTGSEGKDSAAGDDGGKQERGSSRRKQGTTRSGKSRSPRNTQRNTSQEDLASGGRRKRGSDKSASTTQSAGETEQPPLKASPGPTGMGDRWAALCATVDQETQHMQQQQDQAQTVGGLSLLAMGVAQEEVGPEESSATTSAKVQRQEVGEGDNQPSKRRMITPSGVIVHLGD